MLRPWPGSRRSAAAAMSTASGAVRSQSRSLPPFAVIPGPLAACPKGRQPSDYAPRAGWSSATCATPGSAACKPALDCALHLAPDPSPCRSKTRLRREGGEQGCASGTVCVLSGLAAHRREDAGDDRHVAETSGGPMQMCQRRSCDDRRTWLRPTRTVWPSTVVSQKPCCGACDGRDWAAVAVMAAFVRIPGGLACVLVDVGVRSGGSRQRAERQNRRTKQQPLQTRMNDHQ